MRKTRTVRSNRRLPRSRNAVGFIRARPGRHRDRDRLERLDAVAAKLELRAGRDRDRDAGSDLDDLLAVAELAPHPSAAGGEIPDLLDRAMGYGPGHSPCRRSKRGHAAARRRTQQANFRAVWRDCVGRRADFPGFERHGMPQGVDHANFPTDGGAEPMLLVAPILQSSIVSIITAHCTCSKSAAKTPALVEPPVGAR